VGSGPGATSQCCHAMPDGQLHPFAKSSVQPSPEAYVLQDDREICLCPEAHDVPDAHQLAPPGAFFHLARDQARCHLPLLQLPPSSSHFSPLPKLSCQRREGEIQASTGEQRQTVLGQEPSQGVDEQVCSMLGARTQREHGQNLGARVAGQPEPAHVLRAAQAATQFIQLEVRERELGADALMQGLCRPASARAPGGAGGLPLAENPFGRGRV